jgi:hypothetical protein
MSGQLPEGVELADLQDHAQHVILAGQLINMTGMQLAAPEGSEEQAIAEMMLLRTVERLTSLHPSDVGNVVLILLNIIQGIGSQEEVQRWFDEQLESVKELLEGNES